MIVPLAGREPPQSKRCGLKVKLKRKISCALIHSAVLQAKSWRTRSILIQKLKDGGCLKDLFLNKKNYGVCSPHYLQMKSTQFGKKNENQILSTIHMLSRH